MKACSYRLTSCSYFYSLTCGSKSIQALAVFPDLWDVHSMDFTWMLGSLRRVELLHLFFHSRMSPFSSQLSEFSTVLCIGELHIPVIAHTFKFK